MTDKENLLKALRCWVDDPGDPTYDPSHNCTKCSYYVDGQHGVCEFKRICRDALALLKEKEKENRALRKLLDWAVECDWGLDNLGDWWVDRFANEIKGMSYTESLIHLARRYIEVFEEDEEENEPK